MTLQQVLQQAHQRLQAAGVCFGHGTGNAFDEAAWLVLWRLGLPLHALQENAGRVLTAAELLAVQALVEQRISSRRPTAYLTGEAWLQGVPFFVDDRVIVPRSLIAEPLADGTLDAWLGEHTRDVLDLCTGNGSLAVLAALAWPDVQVVATDLCGDALAVAARNVARHGLQSRITLTQGNGLAALDNSPAGTPRSFDLILCNPPYVNQASMDTLPPEYRAEPALALAGGADGMDFIRPLLANAARHLNDDGVLVLEIGHERAHFESAFPKLPVVWLATQETDDQLLLVEKASLLQLEAQS
jgi:ribosomal protein L3 glutamine methyltransferase